jgi:hypothetical protein
MANGSPKRNLPLSRNPAAAHRAAIASAHQKVAQAEAMCARFEKVGRMKRLIAMRASTRAILARTAGAS